MPARLPPGSPPLPTRSDLLKNLARPRLGASFAWLPQKAHRLLLSEVAGLAVAFLAWQNPEWRLPPSALLWVGCTLLIVVPAGVATVHLSLHWCQYVGSLERAYTGFRRGLLLRAYIDPDACNPDAEYKPSGIAEWPEGYVALILDAAESPGLTASSLLDVIATPTGQYWGQVTVSDASSTRLRLTPVDRHNSAFWDSLELRMKADQTAPAGVHLVPSVPAELRSLLSD